MFSIDDKKIKRMEKDLKLFAKRAVPFATKSTLNGLAFETRKNSQKLIKRRMVNRNKFTYNSIRVVQTKSLNVNTQAAIVGSIAEYMDEQEFGGQKTRKGKHGTPIPTSYAAGLSLNAQPRTKLAKKPNKLQSIQLKRKRAKGSNKQALIRKVQNAVDTGDRFIFHDFRGNKKKGVYRIIGGKKNTKKGWPKGARMRLVWDMSKQSVNIPKRPWMKPSVRRATSKTEKIYEQALLFQLRRNNVFDY